MNSQGPTYEILYNQKDISKDIIPYVLSLTYTDKSEGEADEIEITVEDSESLWKTSWYPTKGDTITAKIIDKGNILDCGRFTIDEISASGSIDGDTFSIKGIAAGISKSIRSRSSYAHENKSLQEIVNTVASKHNLKVIGNFETIKIKRVHQYRESDLSFLCRLSYQYGYAFSIRDSTLFFSKLQELETKEEALTITKNEVTSYSFTDKTANTFQKSKIKYHSPIENRLIEHEELEPLQSSTNVKNDSLILHITAENEQQAQSKAKAALYKANSFQQVVNIEMPGNLYAIAGNTCVLEQWGKLSGLYYIINSTHSLVPDGGYTTSFEGKRVR